MSWKKCDGNFVGINVEGDPSMPHTKWWNILWLLFFGWQKVVVMRVNTAHTYHVGYRDFRGKTMLCDERMWKNYFRAKVGREDCTFFAVNEHGREVNLEVLTYTTKKSKVHEQVPMI